MWSFLKRLRAEGFHFRRQAPFRGYFLDFVCHAQRLVIEVDGRMHEYRIDQDRVRDTVLASQGYRTIRIPNEAIRDNFEGVTIQIRAALGFDPTRLGCAEPPSP
jgi:very-short-patch-repair endonuclease